MKIKPILLTLIAATALTTSGCVTGPYDYAYTYSNRGYSNCNYYQTRPQVYHCENRYSPAPPRSLLSLDEGERRLAYWEAGLQY